MRLRRRLLDLLRQEGHPASETVAEALDDLLAVVLRENGAEDPEEPDADGEDEDEDEESDAEEDSDDAYAAGVRHIACPHCGERIALAIDLSGEGQDAIQDCEVCCSPIRVVYTVVSGRLASFHTET